MPISLVQVFDLVKGVDITATDDVSILDHIFPANPKQFLADIKDALAAAYTALPEPASVTTSMDATSAQRAAITLQQTALAAVSASLRRKLKLKANTPGTGTNPSTDPNDKLASKPSTVRVVVEVTV
jgi:hypothetical protein